MSQRIEMNIGPNDSDGHYYYHGGMRFPSVTTIVSAVERHENGGMDPQFVVRWKNGLRNKGIDPEVFLQHTQMYGTFGHFRVLNSLSPTTIPLPEADMDNMPDDMLEIVDIIHTMFDNCTVRNKNGKSVLFKDNIAEYPRWIEKSMVSKKYMFGGQADLICKMEGELTLVDIKTSAALRDHHILQLGAYSILMEEQPKIGMPDKFYIVRLHPFLDRNPTLDGCIHDIPLHRIMGARKEFLDILNSYNELYRPRDKKRK